MRKIPYFLPEYISTPHAPMPAAMPKQRAVGENCWTWCKVALLAIKKFPQCSSWFQCPFSSGGLHNRAQGTLCGQDCAVGFNFLVVWRHFRLVHHNKLKPRRSGTTTGRTPEIQKYWMGCLCRRLARSALLEPSGLQACARGACFFEQGNYSLVGSR